jgi:hypothetical protein
MPNQPLTDEQLKDRVVEQASAGDFIGARQTIRGIDGKGHQHDAWIAILGIQMDRRDVQGIKETIVACTDHSLLHCLWYRELPLYVYRAGDVAGALEIAKTMGDFGQLSLVVIPIGLAAKGDFVRAREAVVHIDDEPTRSHIMNMVDELQQKGTSPQATSQN